MTTCLPASRYFPLYSEENLLQTYLLHADAPHFVSQSAGSGECKRRFGMECQERLEEAPTGGAGVPTETLLRGRNSEESDQNA
jgi:hypothetical protein